MEEIAHDLRLWLAVVGLFITAWLLRNRQVKADD